MLMPMADVNMSCYYRRLCPSHAATTASAQAMKFFHVIAWTRCLMFSFLNILSIYRRIKKILIRFPWILEV